MSLKGTIRDSWNVWRRKVDIALGGSVEDIKASEVTYDGTTSELEASNVQGAIDETASSIGEINTTLENVNGYLVAKNTIDHVEVVGDGVKTVAEILNELFSSFLTMLDNLEDDEYCTAVGISMPGLGVTEPHSERSYYSKSNKPALIQLNFPQGNNSGGVSVNTVLFRASNSILTLSSTTNGTSTYIDYSSRPYDLGKVGKFHYQLYKAI